MLEKMLHLLPPETAHKLAMLGLKLGFVPNLQDTSPESLQIHVLGRDFKNPIGLAAGFDKNAEAISGLFKLGFGFIEVGTVTLFPQEGNPGRRLFRLPKHKALINRMGLNNKGVEAIAQNLEKYHLGETNGRPIGINFGFKQGPDGLNKQEHLDQLSQKLSTFAEYGDYFVLNISCPNVKGGREDQFSTELVENIKTIRKNLNKTAANAKLLLKIAPDFTEEQLKEFIPITLKHKIDGLIVSNSLPNNPVWKKLSGPYKREQGGLTGAPLCNLNTKLIHKVYKISKGKIPLIGLGGIFTAEDAYTKIRAGASLVQIYTSFIYEGPKMLPKMKIELDELLKKDGFKTISDAVGADH